MKHELFRRSSCKDALTTCNACFIYRYWCIRVKISVSRFAFYRTASRYRPSPARGRGASAGRGEGGIAENTTPRLYPKEPLRTGSSMTWEC
jgi:hypothetical protein